MVSKCLLFVLALVTVIFYIRRALPTGFPPGPKPWPFIENVFHFSRANVGLINLCWF